jgi:CubicO group peptidase (beta-lactamase class C family)
MSGPRRAGAQPDENKMRQGRRTLLGLALAGAISQMVRAAPGPGAPALLDAELAAIAADPACQLASVSVLAIRNGAIACERQFGQRSIAAARPANERTLYRIASISKMMTTLGVMMLVEQGKLSLDADAGDYLGFPLRNPHFPERVVTLRTLLSHTSSLRDDAGYSWPSDTALSTILVPGTGASSAR